MRKVWIIANREYKKYFSTPAAYAIAFMLLLILGFLFYINILGALVSQFAPGVDIVLGPLVFLLLFVTPAITMHLLSDEQRMGTIELLLTSPIKDWELVVGKWLGGFLFVATLVLVTLIYPFFMNFMISPCIDQGPLISGYLGVLLVSASLVAVGVAVSAVFSNQIASFFVTLGLLLLLWIISAPNQSGAGSSQLLTYLDFRQHFQTTFINGVIDVRDIVYYLSLTAISLFLGSAIVELRRWR